jgi:hypothetical protein
VTNCIIKMPQIVINYEVCLPNSKFGHARTTLRTQEKQVSTAWPENSNWNAREDPREGEAGRTKPGGHLTQSPHCSPCERLEMKNHAV